MVVISVAETTFLWVAAVPLKLTSVVPVKLFPRIVTAVPTKPMLGRGCTNGARPIDRLKAVP